MSNGWDYQLPNYTARMITVMDIDHYESDEGGIGFNLKLDTLGSTVYPIQLHLILFHDIPSNSHSHPKSLVWMDIATRFPWLLPHRRIPTRCSARAEVEALCSMSVWMAGRRVAAAWSVPDQRTPGTGPGCEVMPYP